MYSSLAQSVEHSAVNRVVVGSSPTGGVTHRNVSKKYQKSSKKCLHLRTKYGNINLVAEISDKEYGSMVKRSRHRPFTAVTRVRFPVESLCRCGSIGRAADL